MKQVAFLGDSLDAVRSFPERSRREVGYQIDRLQRGLEPDDWKPLTTIGPGVRELRVREAAGAFRVVYLASFSEAVYVLHAFRKTTQTTSQRDLERATTRYKELMRRRAI